MHISRHRRTVFPTPDTAEDITMPYLDYALPLRTGDNAQSKVRVAGLMVACPVTQDNPCDCPLRAVRQLPLDARFRWLTAQRPDQLRDFLTQHAECITRKEQEDREPA